jgi:hypothetical protein
MKYFHYFDQIEYFHSFYRIKYFHYFDQIEYFLSLIEYFHYFDHIEYFVYFYQSEYFHYIVQIKYSEYFQWNVFIILPALTIPVNSLQKDILMHFLNFGFRLFESDQTKLPHREGPCAHARILLIPERYISISNISEGFNRH